MKFWTVSSAALLALLAALGTLPLQAQEASKPPLSADYNITLVTDNAPDFTDVKSYLRSITSQYSQPQDKAIGIWRWSQRLRKQTNYVTEGGVYVLDPILFFTSYGYTNCGIISGVNNSLWLNMGWKAHYVQLSDHTVCETSWDGGKNWHMFDNSMSIFCYNDKGEVASVREIQKDSRFYLENFAPECGTNSVKGLNDHQGWRVGVEAPVNFQRSLANGLDSYQKISGIFDDHLAIEWGRTYTLNLRPGEQYTRYFQPLETGKPDPHNYRPLRPMNNDPNSFHQNIRANGVWHYAPDLRNPATRNVVYSDSGVTWTKEGVRGPGHVVFKVSAANIVTSAKIALEGSGATVSVSRDGGIRWGSVSIKDGAVDLLQQVAGGTEYLVKVELAGADSLLSSIAIDTIAQLNRPSLPRLVRGSNQVQVRLGPQLETITLAPLLNEGNHKKTVHDEKSITVHAKPYFNVATLQAGAHGEPCYVTWKIETPTPIVSAVYGGNVCVRSPSDSVALLHSFDGKTFSQDYQKKDGSVPFDQVVHKTVEGIPAESREVYFRYQFQTPNADSTANWKSPGIQSALMTVQHQPRAVGFTPIEVTYCWVEHRDEGDVERRHTELVTSPQHQYSINVAGYRDPTMKWVRMNLKGSAPDGAVKYGYSDGKDVGPGARPLWAKYIWGTNLAAGKTYTLEGKQDPANPDSGKDLTDGIIAPPDTYVSLKWMPTNVMFAKDVSPVATLDLGRAEQVAAVRVHAGQSGSDFRLTYPDNIKVETSTDGKTFSPAGSVGFRQVYDPPADYVPWERDESAEFKGLPAGGRLVYAYRIIFDKPVEARYVRVSCANRKGWGVMLSEIQAFDKVTIDRNVPPLVVLPPIKAHP